MIQGVSETMALLRLLVCLTILASGGQSHAESDGSGDEGLPKTSNQHGLPDRAKRNINDPLQAFKATTKPEVPAIVVAQATPERVRRPSQTLTCKLHPPKGYTEIESIAYECNDIEQMINAQTVIDAKVTRIFEQRRQAKSADRERQRARRSRQQSEQQRKQIEADRLAEQALKQEQAALAASEAVQAELSSDITKKMIKLCGKTWAKGEHRCYCEKYIEFAPPQIQSNPSCK